MTDSSKNSNSIDVREKLPDALRVLVEDYPRDLWESNARFDGLVQFWLDRHLMFRRLLSMLQQEAEAVIDGGMASDQYQARLSRLGGMFFNELHTHHHVEDHHYFPKLQEKDQRLSAGFEILDHDHHALEELLGRFAEGANTILQPESKELVENTKSFRDQLETMELFLNRHLEDEEELVVPIILKYGVEM